ncbi:carbamate kinase [Rhizobium sp. PL01]|uniref:carbamate kinase n=1 Tax=Rhizobium sp. PL01 TaxID=3085631 RepID=UPI00298167DF|nr:carbamate kinase [Rhizobium sp. PL01]MDW5317491.1 carbamate kinase [Rhizobium sp. PL01]
MLIVVALGGNALLKRGEPMTVEMQRTNIRGAARSLATLIGAGHTVVVTHGNGPQIGLLALQAAAGPKDGLYPLDILGAETDGMIGYMIEQELRNALPKPALLATLLTQIRVDENDPAFQSPTKPIGPVYDEITAEQIRQEQGWTFAIDGSRWRRVVASPEPREILELAVIAMLVNCGVIVICAGGGGVPVVSRGDGDLAGIEAVIDKDRASALLAERLNADMLLLLTDVDAVYIDFGQPFAKAVANVSISALAGQSFAAGSMGPKIEAATKFVNMPGKMAAIGRLEDALAIVNGKAGTRIVAGEGGIQFRN